MVTRSLNIHIFKDPVHTHARTNTRTGVSAMGLKERFLTREVFKENLKELSEVK